MSYDLRIMFSGLALYVPDATAMHVLLPATEHGAGNGGGAGHPHVEPHFTRIFYDEAYEDPRATGLSRRYRMMEFNGRTLDLTRLPTDEVLDARIPGEIPSMEPFANPVPRTLLEGNLDAKLAGRVTMKTGAVTDCLLGARFDVEGETKRITVRSEWTIRGIKLDEPVPPSAGGKEGARRPVLPEQPAAGLAKPLYPIGQTIQLMVFNTLPVEFPPHGPGFVVTETDGDADHFRAYYDLCPPKNPGNPPFPKQTDQLAVDVDGDEVANDDPQAINGMTCVQAMAMAEQA